MKMKTGKHKHLNQKTFAENPLNLQSSATGNDRKVEF